MSRDQVEAYGPPEGYGETDLGMSNCDHTIDDGLEKALRTSAVYGRHSASEFNSLVWFDKERGLFVEQIWRYHEPIANVSADTLEGLMRAVNDEWGWE